MYSCLLLFVAANTSLRWINHRSSFSIFVCSSIFCGSVYIFVEHFLASVYVFTLWMHLPYLFWCTFATSNQFGIRDVQWCFTVDMLCVVIGCRVGKMLKTADEKYSLEACQQMWLTTSWRSIFLNTGMYVHVYVYCHWFFMISSLNSTYLALKFNKSYALKYIDLEFMTTTSPLNQARTWFSCVALYVVGNCLESFQTRFINLFDLFLDITCHFLCRNFGKFSLHHLL